VEKLEYVVDEGTLPVSVGTTPVVESEVIWKGAVEVSTAEDMPDAVGPVPVGPTPDVELEDVGNGVVESPVEGPVDEAEPLVTDDKEEVVEKPTVVKPDGEIVLVCVSTEELKFGEVGNEVLDEATVGELVSPYGMVEEVEMKESVEDGTPAVAEDPLVPVG
jgi:hypothetical protein